MQRVIAALLLLCISFVVGQDQPSQAQLNANDVAVFQYALLLERLEAYFYTTFQAQFTAQNFVDAGLTAEDYSYFDLIRNHEQAHVRLLESIVPSPTSGNCTYNFSSVTTVQTYIQIAAVLENTGVSAYDGAIARIYNKDYQEAAAVIATVEARHASYLNNINGRVPFPNVTDIALPPTTIATVVFGPGGFASCPLLPSFSLPVLYVVQPNANASDSSQPTPQSLSSNDILVLQYALFLEHLEASFYNYVFTNNLLSGQSDAVRAYVGLIREHENSHVSTLTSVITNLGGTPNPACTSYNFSQINSGNALGNAAFLENTGTYAYDGAVKFIYNNALKEAAATIATVEARHASYLNTIAGSPQGPVRGGDSSADDGAYDLTYDFTFVTTTVLQSGFIASCDNALPFIQAFQLLVVKPYTTALPTNAPATAAPSTTGTRAPTSTPTASPTSGTVAPTTGTAAPTTGTAAPVTTGTRAPTAAPSTGRVTTTSGASIVGASVVVAMLAAIAAF